MNKVRFSSLVVLLALLMVISACVPPGPAPVATPSNAPAPSTQSAPAPTAAQAGNTPAAQETGAPAAGQNLVPTPPADGSRPLASIPAEKRNERFGGPAPMWIKPNTVYVATIVTDKGNIVAELYQDTPQSVNNFVTLADDGFYDGLTFHRVITDFVAQGGDPTGSGQGGPGYTIPAEIKHDHIRGALAWARTPDEVNPKRDSSGSQFYITLADTPHLNGDYTVFGQVIQGMDVVDKIKQGDVIKQIDVSEAKSSQMPTARPPTPTREPSAPKPQAGRPLASMPVEQREKLYTMPPEMAIDATKSYQATITTTRGNIVVDLDAKTSPKAVNNFVVLANLGYYDGMPVAFVRPGIFAVLGSPNNREDSDIGYTLEPESKPGATKVVTGTVTMYPWPDEKTSTWLASGSQFLLWLDAADQVDVPLSALGQVTSGMDVVTKLATGDKVDKIEIKEK